MIGPFRSVSTRARPGLAARSTALLLLLAVAACGESGQPAPERKEAASLASDAAAEPGSLPNTGNDFSDANSYRLTMPKVRAFVRVREAFNALDESDETFDDGSGDIAGDAATWEKHAGARAILEREGLSAREYALINVSLMENAILAWNEETRKLANAQGVSRENMAFVEANRAELNQLLHVDELMAAQ